LSSAKPIPLSVITSIDTFWAYRLTCGIVVSPLTEGTRYYGALGIEIVSFESAWRPVAHADSCGPIAELATT